MNFAGAGESIDKKDAAIPSTHARLVRLAVNPKIVDMLIDAIRSVLITESGWLSLKLGTWHTSIDKERAKRLVGAIIEQVQRTESSRAVELVLRVIFDRVAEPSGNDEDWEDDFYLVTEALTEISGMASYFWSQLAKRYMKLDPAKAISIASRLVFDGGVRIDLHPYGEELMNTALSEYPGMFLDTVYEAASGSKGYVVDIWFQFNNLDLQGANTESIVEWVKGKGLDGARLVAQFAKPSGERLNEPAATLITDYGGDSIVSGTLESSLQPSSWSGPYSVVLNGVKDKVEPWLADSQINIREWANGVVQRLDQNIARAEERERLEDLFGR